MTDQKTYGEGAFEMLQAAYTAGRTPRRWDVSPAVLGQLEKTVGGKALVQDVVPPTFLGVPYAVSHDVTALSLIVEEQADGR